MPLYSEEEPSAALKFKSVHGKREDNGRFACQVEACGERFYHAKGLMQHYQDKHNIITSKYPHASYMITCM